jgi:hypothetical protein
MSRVDNMSEAELLRYAADRLIGRGNMKPRNPVVVRLRELAEVFDRVAGDSGSDVNRISASAPDTDLLSYFERAMGTP